MKFQQEFDVNEPIDVLWTFFEKPQSVAQCMPGVEDITELDPETFLVQVTQRVGPISATLESRVHITEKGERGKIAFSATGQAVRGAIGNFRAESGVRLIDKGNQTGVRVESEAALAGVLGSVGQKIIARQAQKITEEFAGNLEARLSGSDIVEGEVASSTSESSRLVVPARVVSRKTAANAAPVSVASDGWSKVAAAFGLVNFAIGLAILLKIA